MIGASRFSLAVLASIAWAVIVQLALAPLTFAQGTPKPTVTLTASSDRAKPGESVTLTWSSQNATRCSATGSPFTGTKSLSGQQTLTGLTSGTKTFGLSCTGAGGTGAAQVVVTVVAVPTLTFSTAAVTVEPGRSTTLSWRATNATSCVASGAWTGSRNVTGSASTGALTASTNTFNLTCTGLTGEVTRSVTVTVPARPVVTLTASRSTVAAGGSVTLRWSSTLATRCSATGLPFTGTKAVAGEQTLTNLIAGAKTFRLSCTGTSGTGSAEVQVSVIAPPVITSFTATPAQGASDGKSTLRWNTTNASSCVASGAWSGPQAVSGSLEVGPLTQSSNVFTLRCTGLNGVVEKSVTVEASVSPTVTLTLGKSVVSPLESVSVSWQSTNATACTASGTGWSGARGPSGSVSLSFQAEGSRTFVIECSGAVGAPATASRTLTVRKPPKILSFTADSLLIDQGSQATLTWATEAVRSCTASGAWSGAVDLSNAVGFKSASLTARTNRFVLTCFNDLQESAEAVVTVETIPGPPVSLSISPTKVKSGASAKITWASPLADSCIASGRWSGAKAKQGSEDVVSTMLGTTKFDLSCSNASGARQASTTLEVLAPSQSISPTSLNFGAVYLGSESTAREITLRNTSAVELLVSAHSLQGTSKAQFSYTTDCGARLAAQASCVFRVVFKPSVVGDYAATLRVTTDGNPQLQLVDVNISLTGTSAQPSVDYSLAVPSFMQLDSDQNDPNSVYADNSSPQKAQFLTWPFAVGGYVAEPGTAIPGAIPQGTGDVDDFYRVRLDANQAVLLEFDQAQGNEDLDIYLYTLSGTLVDSSIAGPETQRELVAAPVAGEYFLIVTSAGGAGKYLLLADSTVTRANLGSSALSRPFVIGQAMISLTPEARVRAEMRRDGPSRVLRLPGVGDGEALQLDVMTGEINSVFAAEVATDDVTLRFGQFSDGEQKQKFATLRAIKALSQNADIAFAEPDFIMTTLAEPNDPLYSRQRWHYEIVQLPGVWDEYQGSENVVVAVIDSGVSRHPDLIDNLLTGYDFVSNDPEGDGDGRDADASDPGIVRVGTTVRSSHGTHVAGTISARGNNSLGVSGVSWRTKILPVRALGGTGSGSTSDIVDAMRYAAGLLTLKPSRKADIINLSLGADSRTCSASFQSAVDDVRAAGVIVVAATGNASLSYVGQPANCNGVIAVAAMGARKQISSYSNYGSGVNVAAPGGDESNSVFSTNIRVDTSPTAPSSSFTYSGSIGTSMATPHAAGILALVKGINPSLTPSDVDNLILAGALTDDLGDPGRDDKFGYGALNSARAVAAARTVVPPTAPFNALFSPGRLDFGALTSRITMTVTMTGSLSGFSDFTVAGPSGGWFTIVSKTKVSERAYTFVLEVNRNALTVGAVAATAVFTAQISGGNRSFSIPVNVTRNPTAYTGYGGTQYALLWDPVRESGFGQGVVEAEGPAVAGRVLADAPGDYWLVIGADVDNDFFICGLGEPCAAYPITTGLWQTIAVRGAESGFNLEATFWARLDAEGSAAGLLSQGDRSAIRGLPRHGIPVAPSMRVMTSGDVASSAFGPAAPAPAPTVAGATSAVETAEVKIVSSSEDLLTGSIYEAQSTTVGSPQPLQTWELSYRGNTGVEFLRQPLPKTSEVLWREDGRGRSLPTTAWTRVCDGQIWAVQDGYELRVHQFSRDLRPIGALLPGTSPSVTLATGLACQSGGGVAVQGYVFGVSDAEPPLSRIPTPTQKLMLTIGIDGSVREKSLSPTLFDLGGECAAGRPELQQFCQRADQ